MLSYGLNRYPFVGWNPMESIHVHRNNQKCSGKPKLRQRTDILPVAHVFSLSPTELEKYYSTRKYYRARKIQLKLNVLFERFYSTSNNKVHTNLALFNCGSENLRRFDMQISWCWHGQRGLGRTYILFLYPHLRLKMLISVYIIEQFSAVT